MVLEVHEVDEGDARLHRFCHLFVEGDLLVVAQEPAFLPIFGAAAESHVVVVVEQRASEGVEGEVANLQVGVGVEVNFGVDPWKADGPHREDHAGCSHLPFGAFPNASAAWGGAGLNLLIAACGELQEGLGLQGEVRLGDVHLKEAGRVGVAFVCRVLFAGEDIEHGPASAHELPTWEETHL